VQRLCLLLAIAAALECRSIANAQGIDRRKEEARIQREMDRAARAQEELQRESRRAAEERAKEQKEEAKKHRDELVKKMEIEMKDALPCDADERVRLWLVDGVEVPLRIVRISEHFVWLAPKKGGSEVWLERAALRPGEAKVVDEKMKQLQAKTNRVKRGGSGAVRRSGP